jgi:hypothetical protein
MPATGFSDPRIAESYVSIPDADRDERRVAAADPTAAPEHIERLDFAAMESAMSHIPRFHVIRPWADPVTESCGHDPRSRYVELFWLSVLGPSATWLIRRLADGLELYPDGYELDLHETAQAIGLSAMPGKSAAFARALSRCVLFGMTHRNVEGFDVRRMLPSLEVRHLRRLPEHLRLAHREWHQENLAEHLSIVERGRAEAVAEALLRTGDDPPTVERRLLLLGITPSIVTTALRAVTSRHSQS